MCLRGGVHLALPSVLLLLHLPSALTESNYLGCYADKDILPDLNPETKVIPEDLSVAQCENHCKLVGGGPFKYFGLRKGTECLCGSTYGKYGSSTECNKECKHNTPTNDGQCGGEKAYALYTIVDIGKLIDRIPGGAVQEAQGAIDPNMASDGSVAWKPLGCFKDKSPGRAFNKETQLDDDAMTYTLCAKHCRKHNTRYIALQDGNQCFCGQGPGKEYGESTKCTKPCTGDSRNKCGGPFANQVFELVSVTPAPVTSQHVEVLGETLDCGLPGAVLVAAAVVVATGLGNHAFCTTAIFSATHVKASGSVFIGSVLAQLFMVVVSALLGHILPDSKALSLTMTKLAAAFCCAVSGLLQVHRSFSVAGREQDERRDEYRNALIGCEEKRDDEMVSSAVEGLHSTYCTFVAVLVAEWGSVCQLGIVALACTIDVTAIVQGALLGQAYCSTLACVVSHNSVLLRNNTALKQHFVAGLLFFFLALDSVFDTFDA